MKICGIIVAKENSNRFPGKNYHLIDGVPLFYHNINPLLSVIDRNDIYVATDSMFIKTYCIKNNINIINRGINVSHDDEPYFSVLKYAYQSINKRYDIIISILANSIGHNFEKLQKGIDILTDDDKIQEIRSFDEKGQQSGIFLFRESLFLKDCMVLNHMASVKSNGKEIHFKDEL